MSHTKHKTFDFKVRGQRFDFKVGSKVKVTYLTLLLSLVNKVKPFYIANPLKFSSRAYFATLALLLFSFSLGIKMPQVTCKSCEARITFISLNPPSKH